MDYFLLHGSLNQSGNLPLTFHSNKTFLPAEPLPSSWPVSAWYFALCCFIIGRIDNCINMQTYVFLNKAGAECIYTTSCVSLVLSGQCTFNCYWNTRCVLCFGVCFFFCVWFLHTFPALWVWFSTRCWAHGIALCICASVPGEQNKNKKTAKTKVKVIPSPMFASKMLWFCEYNRHQVNILTLYYIYIIFYDLMAYCRKLKQLKTRGK